MMKKLLMFTLILSWFSFVNIDGNCSEDSYDAEYYNNPENDQAWCEAMGEDEEREGLDYGDSDYSDNSYGDSDQDNSIDNSSIYSDEKNDNNDKYSYIGKKRSRNSSEDETDNNKKEKNRRYKI